MSLISISGRFATRTFLTVIVLAAVSTSLNIWAQLAPVILVQPNSLTNCPGTTANFNVVATGLSLVYQWKSNSVAMADGGNVVGSTTANLTLSNVQESDAKTYTCTITNSSGSVTTDPKTLTVNATTAAGAGMANQTNCPGANITFTSTVTGTSLTYVWKKDGILLIGETGSSFTTNNIGASAAGTYCVEVTGACGNATNCATLTVNPVTSATALTNQTNCPGTSATFSTTAGGTGPFSYVWRKDGSLLAGETGSSFKVKPCFSAVVMKENRPSK